MCERYDEGIKAYIRNIGREELLVNNPKIAEFTHGKIKLSGLLVENSLVIPISVVMNGNEMLTKMVESNVNTLRENSPNESPEFAACHVMELPYNGQTMGLRSHGQNFSLIGGIHFYPDDEISQEKNFDFIKFAQDALASKGTSLRIIESL
jgi:hypothetical protein